MDVMQVRVGEGALLRDVRLRALAEAPQAFCSTLAEEAERPMERWEELAGSDAEAVFVVEARGSWDAMAGCYLRGEEPGVAVLWGMWVDPARRGKGAGRALVDAVAGWARERGAGELELSVLDGNDAAETLYRDAGFADAGRSGAERIMRLAL